MWLIVSSLSPHNIHLLFCCVLSIFALMWLVFMALFCAAIRRDSVSLLRFPFLSHVHVFSCEMSLKTSTELFFFTLLFSGYCRSVNLCVVSIVSGDCNQSSSAFFYVVFESLYRWVRAVFKAGKSPSPSLLDTYSLSTSSLGCNALCMVVSFLVLWSICLSSSLVLFNNGPEYLTRGTAQLFIPLTMFLL